MYIKHIDISEFRNGGRCVSIHASKVYIYIYVYI